MNSTIEKDPRETSEIKAILIFEVVGRPPEHLIETLQDIIKKVSEEKGVVVEKQKINKCAPMKESTDFYTNFAEIEVEVEDISILAILTHKYMPAYVEVISPEMLSISNNCWNGILNDLTRKLHVYDEVARVLQMKEAQMQKEIKELKSKKK